MENNQLINFFNEKNWEKIVISYKFSSEEIKTEFLIFLTSLTEEDFKETIKEIFNISETICTDILKKLNSLGESEEVEENKKEVVEDKRVTHMREMVDLLSKYYEILKNANLPIPIINEIMSIEYQKYPEYKEGNVTEKN